MQPLYVLALTLVAAVASANELYVSPNGDDAHPGTSDKPLASLDKALSLMEGQGGGTIWLEEGEYCVSDGIRLNRKHAGTTANPLVIRSRAPRGARLTGARSVVDFQPITPEAAKDLISKEARQHVQVADLRAEGFSPLSQLPGHFGASGAEEVIFGDMPMQSARWPNEDFASFTEVIDPGASDPVHWVTREVYRPGSFQFPADRPRHWDFSRGVYLHGFWCYEWADETLRAASYDPATRELRLAAKHRYGIGHPWRKDAHHEFYAIHVFEELDQAGEYYLDRQENKLYFWPPQDLGKVPVLVTLCANPLLQLEETRHVRLEGLVIENGRDWGVRIAQCDHVRVDRCLVRNMGLGGIQVTGGTENHIVRCEVTRTGSRAVAMTAGQRKTLARGGCSVVGNHLHHVGRFDWGGGRGVTLGGCGNRVAHNLIHHCPTGAIAYGGNEHLLELNEIHHVCLLYGDVGVFYTGRDWASRGNILRWNYIHDVVENSGFGSQAFYLDDCDSGDTVTGNIVYRGAGKGVVIGGGRDNLIQGNVFIDMPKGIHVDARGPRGITLDKPGSWNLKAKCEQVDYQSELWKERYPKLAAVLSEQPLLPLGNVIRDNLFIGCEATWALRDEVKPEWLSRENNHEFPMSAFPFLPQSPQANALDLDSLSRVWQKVPGFEPIPVERIGPQGMSLQK